MEPHFNLASTTTHEASCNVPLMLKSFLGSAGSLCEVELDFCLSSPCSNGGQCIPDRHGSSGKPYICNCPEGFHGEECEVRLGLTKNPLRPISVVPA